MTTESTTATTPDEPDERWETLARYLVGESSATEAAQVERWLAEDPRRAELLDALRRSTASIELPPQRDIDVEAALRRISARLDEPAVHALDSVRWRKLRGSPLARAAVVVVLLGAVVAVWRTSHDRDEATSDAPAIADRTFTAPVGAVDSARLEDGTRVLLAPGSRLTVASGYGHATHEVELAGEALFDVAATAAGRFTVRSGQAFVRDLGTTFAVRAGPTAVRVVVTSGSVLLGTAAASDSGTVLRAGDRGVLSPDGQVSAERGGATRDDLAWTAGRLVFANATLAQVADELRRWYGIQLQLADSALAARHFTASFQGEDVQSVLDVIALALDVDIQRSGNTAVVRRR
jgi:transmembrane sensor